MCDAKFCLPFQHENLFTLQLLSKILKPDKACAALVKMHTRVM